MNNLPVVKLGIVAVSRDCFPIELSQKRRAAIKAAYKGDLYECPVTVENEQDMLKAVEDVKKAECNALVVFLGNFGPETPETLIAKNFDGPCMFVAAAEGDGDMINGRGDAYCGMLNCSYNLGMRHLKGYIPEYPVGTADDIAVGSVLEVVLDEDNQAVSVTVRNLNAGGGFGGSGEVTNGTSANTITEDTEVDSETYTSTGDDENALRVDGATVTLKDITIEKTAGSSSNTEDGDFYGLNAGLLVQNPFGDFKGKLIHLTEV